MHKTHFTRRPFVLNTVFILCLAGSILFALASEAKAHRNASYQAMISTQRQAVPAPCSSTSG